MTAPDFPNKIDMRIYNPWDKDKTQIQWEYKGKCDPLWSTNMDSGQGFLARCGKNGDFECDDQKAEWTAYGTGFERTFDCKITGGL